MPGNLHVRNLDDDLIARLKRRAARHGRSTEAKHREILRQALLDEVEPSFDTLAAELRKLTRRNLRAAAAIPSGSTTTQSRAWPGHRGGCRLPPYLTGLWRYRPRAGPTTLPSW
jgi:plasmid stability protein